MPSRRPLLAFVLALCAWVATLGGEARAPSPSLVLAASTTADPPIYVSLGDSLAAGWQPGRRGHDRATKQGYVDVVARSLGRTHPGLESHKLSCGGATAGTLLFGSAGCQPNGQPSQVERAEALLSTHDDVVLVTVDIGDNDIEYCFDADAGSVDRTCLQRGEARIRQFLPKIAARLRAATPPGTPVVGFGDYDQFPSLCLEGAGGRAAARRSVSVIAELNRLASRLYRQAGVEVADAGARFATGDLTDRRRLPGHGMVPLAVYNICTWTWACSPEPIGHDDHARPGGYYQLGESILDVLRGTR